MIIPPGYYVIFECGGDSRSDVVTYLRRLQARALAALTFPHIFILLCKEARDLLRQYWARVVAEQQGSFAARKMAKASVLLTLLAVLTDPLPPSMLTRLPRCYLAGCCPSSS